MSYEERRTSSGDAFCCLCKHFEMYPIHNVLKNRFGTSYTLDVCSLKCSIQYCCIIKLSHYDLCLVFYLVCFVII